MMVPDNMICDNMERGDIQGDFIKDVDIRPQSSISLLKSQKTIKELLRICKSRTEMSCIWKKYKWYFLSSLIALVGLVISIRMVSLHISVRINPTYNELVQLYLLYMMFLPWRDYSWFFDEDDIGMSCVQHLNEGDIDSNDSLFSIVG